MHRLNDIIAKLTPAQVKEVEDFAEFLVSRQDDSRNGSAKNLSTPSKIDFEGWAGCLAHVDKTAVQLAHEATEIRAASAEIKE